jgi:uncharacterized protein with HEPN domain
MPATDRYPPAVSLSFAQLRHVRDRLEHLKPGMDLGVLARIVDDLIDDCIDVHERLLRLTRGMR